MKTKNIFTLLLIVLSTMTYAQSSRRQEKKDKAAADKATKEWRYEIECANNGKEGTYQIKVWSYGKTSELATIQAKKNAVHGVIFKGFSGGDRGCASQRPLASKPNIEEEKADFFEPFFEDGGKYMKYVTQSGEQNIAGGDIIKIGKEYKVGIIVSVSKDALRIDLEDAGIIKKLSAGF